MWADGACCWHFFRVVLLQAESCNAVPWCLLCVRCSGLQRHERGSKASKTKINPYFKFELGGANAIKKRSTPIKNSNSTPDFKGEVRCFFAVGAIVAVWPVFLSEFAWSFPAPSNTIFPSGFYPLRL